MSYTEKAYCRLCAGIKQHNELTDLELDEKAWEEVKKKLTRLNCKLDVTENILPRTVCVLCITTLQTAVSFVDTFETAQIELNNVVLLQSVQIEIESVDSEGEQEKDEKLNEPSTEKDIEGSDSTITTTGNNGNDGNNDNDDQKDYIDKDISDDDSIPEYDVPPQENNQKQDILQAISLLQSKLNWNDYSWTCTHCETLFPNFSELRNHSMEHHQICNAHKCTDCNKKYFVLDKFLMHICTHRRYLQLTCYKCHKVFDSKREVNKHKGCDLTSKFKCDGCNTGYPTLEKLNQHMKTYYKNAQSRHVRPAKKTLPPPPPADLVCVICKRKLKSKETYNKHLLIHTERKKEYTCHLCGKCFMEKAGLTEHLKFHGDERPWKCEICNCGYRSKYYLKVHSTVHDKYKQFKCDNCGKAFRLKSQLAKHSIVHTDRFPFVCEYCNKGFRFRGLLRIHLRHHTGEKPYSCDTCVMTFAHWSNYNKHMTCIHNMDMRKKKATG